MSRILICGGAGYIGSHVTLSLVRAGYDPIVADNFANSCSSVIDRLNEIGGSQVEFHKVDLTDKVSVFNLFSRAMPSAVIQLAGLKAVAHSVSQPLHYYSVNLGITVNILSAMSQFGCPRIVFSSSATVYGEPAYTPIDELHKVCPNNPYGRTKYFQEEIIRDWVACDKGVSSVVLRYFNPVGADSSGLIGEDPSGVPNNLMPILGETAAGNRTEVVVFGQDYGTRDGTCERDYIHVSDLADAHLAALECNPIDNFEVFNVGTGRGITVREAIAAYSNALGCRLPERLGQRRNGDVASSVASNNKIFSRLHWRPIRSFEDACRDDLRWREYKSNSNSLSY